VSSATPTRSARDQGRFETRARFATRRRACDRGARPRPKNPECAERSSSPSPPREHEFRPAALRRGTRRGGDRRETILAVTIPERLEAQEVLRHARARNITGVNYRIAIPVCACIVASRSHGDESRKSSGLERQGLHTADLSEDEMAAARAPHGRGHAPRRSGRTHATPPTSCSTASISGAPRALMNSFRPCAPTGTSACSTTAIRGATTGVLVGISAGHDMREFQRFLTKLGYRSDEKPQSGVPAVLGDLVLGFFRNTASDFTGIDRRWKRSPPGCRET